MLFFAQIADLLLIKKVIIEFLKEKFNFNWKFYEVKEIPAYSTILLCNNLAENLTKNVVVQQTNWDV